MIIFTLVPRKEREMILGVMESDKAYTPVDVKRLIRELLCCSPCEVF
jgi:hypothetical protein